MNLTYLSEKDKKSAECEVEFLRVITGPTIIKFFESFKENQEIYIVMEYGIVVVVEVVGLLEPFLCKKIQNIITICALILVLLMVEQFKSVWII